MINNYEKLINHYLFDCLFEKQIETDLKNGKYTSVNKKELKKQVQIARKALKNRKRF